MNNKIPIIESSFSESSIIDDVGKVLFWKGRVFRAIQKGYEEQIKDILHSGMIDELVRLRLFPKTWITDYELDGFGLILEHEKLKNITYPHEWTLSMHRDAALAVLKVNMIALTFGYQTKDCHAFNIIYDAANPIFIDFGSFVKVPGTYKGFFAYEEFCRCYYYPLRIWKSGDLYTARGVLCLERNEYMPHESYLLYRFPFCRFVGPRILNKVCHYYFIFKNISSHEKKKILTATPYNLGRFLNFLLSLNFLPFQRMSYRALARRIEKISPKKKSPSVWGGYHNQLIDTDGNITSTPRFDRILEIVNSLDIESVVEIGGNQGVFSRLLKQNTGVKQVICTDYDIVAIDKLYLKIKETKEDINIAVLDVLYPITNDYVQHPSIRFKSDAVMALAVTHHFILSQKQPIERILKILACYSYEYVFIEFMPLGLFDGEKTEGSLPAWYTVEWFRESFAQYFHIHIEEKLEVNRILFVGILKR